ncbi:uncharacterized protein LOC132760315 [Ruditapes philippinarum]|uniref:uncharacterized protein LOC132760315 n=1 Tax=Ruditapes philippinarum TaxID=129788 RepID=UPI00295BCA7F|nr:uncharacterized protein LOC132760315 [Ruditapes philippinarum]
MEFETDQPERKPRRTIFKVDIRRRRLVLFVYTLFVLVQLGLLCYVTYKVESLSAHGSQSNSANDDPTAAYLADPDEGETKMENMSDMQKFFFNQGIMIDHKIRDCTGIEAKVSFPNIDYAFFGYDIYRGFPLADSRDPGFTHPIFKSDYSNMQQTADCRFALPNGYIAVASVSCVTSFSSTVLETKNELQDVLSTMAEVSVGYKAFAFSSSFGYRKMTSTLDRKKSVYIISSATCDYYFVKLRKQMPPSFDDDFLIWLSKLDASDSNTTYIEFMDRFGTHFLSEVTFGARFSNEYEMSLSDYQSIKESGYSASARASFTGKVSIGAGFSLETSQRQAAQEFSERVETHTKTVGAAPPSNGDALTWASEVKDNPVPSKLTLKNIEDLFVPEYVASLGIDYETIRFNIIKYKEDYRRYRAENNPELSFPDPYNKTVMWNVKKTLRVLGGFQGQWGHIEFCPDRQYAIGYNLKIEPYQGSADDTGLNAIRLICADRFGKPTGKTITSWESKWGSYRTDKLCPKAGQTATFLTRFRLQMHDYFHIGASFATFKCQDILKTTNEIPLVIFPGYGEPWGTYWEESESCPSGSAICGMRTKVEEPQGKNDDSALNNVKFYCCALDITK